MSSSKLDLYRQRLKREIQESESQLNKNLGKALVPAAIGGVVASAAPAVAGGQINGNGMVNLVEDIIHTSLEEEHPIRKFALYARTAHDVYESIKT